VILVTGAAGKTGRAIIRALAARGAEVRAFVHREAQSATVTAEGARSVSVGSLDDIEALTRAAAGAAAIYHLAPNVSPHEFAYGTAAIAAAKAACVPRFVFHSVLHPQIEAMPHHWQKGRVEEALFASNLAATILQPTAYMQNLLASRRSIVDDGVWRVPYRVEARLSLVDIEDVAEAASRVLLEPGHAGATYELVGTLPLSQVEVADILSHALGRPVRAEAQPIGDWEKGATALDDHARDTLIRMFRYYDRHGLAGNPHALERLLGRPPVTLAGFARRAAAAFRHTQA